ncbi:MAG: gamma-glutamylcyclotransferase [Pseudobdellovibrionaceae bacterium]
MTEVFLFVCGPLTSGMVEFGNLKSFIREQEPASTFGSAYRLKVGFPAMIREGGDLIQGTLLKLNASELLVNLLDQFHGFDQMNPSKSLFVREEVAVATENGSKMVWAYFLNPLKMPKDAVLIPGGDWRSSLQQEPPLVEKLTERQKTYVQKLGSSSGRDIVPIDLPLYRELMTLELIVDKGRRLALTKLGKDVYRHL